MVLKVRGVISQIFQAFEIRVLKGVVSKIMYIFCCQCCINMVLRGILDVLRGALRIKYLVLLGSTISV